MKKIYSISLLLNSQPNQIKKKNQFIHLINLAKISSLYNIRLSRKNYISLDKVLISPDKLKLFLKKANLPENKFFPLFLIMKKEYLDSKKELLKNKKNKIQEILKNIPSLNKKYLGLFLNYEIKISDNKPVIFIKYFIPTTYKKANQIIHFDSYNWFLYIDEYINKIESKYNRCDSQSLKTMNNKLYLNFSPEEKLDYDMLIRRYRNISHIVHPDKGGTHESFILLQKIKNDLLVCIEKRSNIIKN